MLCMRLMNLSAQTYHRIQKPTRTITDLVVAILDVRVWVAGTLDRDSAVESRQTRYALLQT